MTKRRQIGASAARRSEGAGHLIYRRLAVTLGQGDGHFEVVLRSLALETHADWASELGRLARTTEEE